MKKNVILYGVGNNVVSAFECLMSTGNIPVCLCDGNREKHYKKMKFFNRFHNTMNSDIVELEILPITEAVQRFPDYYLYISPSFAVKCEIIEFLLSENIIQNTDRIMNYEEYVRGCIWINAFDIWLRSDSNSIENRVCCSTDEEKIILGYNDQDITDDKVRENIEKYFMRRKRFFELQGLKKCKNCVAFTYIPKTEYINRIVLDGNGICQSKCTYCSFEKYKIRDIENYVKFFIKTCEELKKQGLLASDFTFSISLGEISINPKKKLIMDYVQNNAFGTQINSNAIKYDKGIEYLLTKGAYLIVSIDAGSVKTFKKVRGIDAYKKVLSNVKKYNAVGRVFVKYIFTIDGSNCGDNDIYGFVNFIQELKPTEPVMISYDMRYKGKERVSNDIINSMVKLVQSLKNIRQKYIYAWEGISVEVQNIIEEQL